MSKARLLAWLVALIGLSSGLSATECNLWPVKVTEYNDSGRVESWQAAGPIAFSKTVGDSTWFGARPFYVARRDASGQVAEFYILYPIFSYRSYGKDGSRWNIVTLIDHDSTHGENKENDGTRTDIYPFYFARRTSDPATSYTGFFPIYGTIKQRFGSDKLNWVLFPLYSRTDTRGVIVTESPWPFVKTIHGGDQRGFYLWPLFGWRTREGYYKNRFWLWPLGYQNKSLDPDAPGEKFGFLPFYARESTPTSKSETYLWPFFGYSNSTRPHYHEVRYFWPFFLQAEGEVGYRHRWAPFYSHSNIKGYDEQWLFWPFFKKTTSQEGPLIQTKRQFLQFVVWSLDQRSTTNPQLAHASKSHGWPFFSYWDNGAGLRQMQIFSPFEVFYQNNQVMRVNYTPLFALYRYDQRSPNDVRHSFLFDLVTWHRQPQTREFHFGPILGILNQPKEKRIVIGHGLLAMERSLGDNRWKFSWLNFSPKPTQPSAATAHL